MPDAPITPPIILSLCVLAGVGTVLLLPGRAEASLRKIGGVIVLTAGMILAATLLRWTAGGTSAHMGIYFWIFSAIALLGALRVITHTRPVYSALYFVMTVFASAGLFILLWAEFMAAALVLIYAGAILVTYVFVIMLAAEAVTPGKTGALAGLAEHDALSRDPVAACAVGFALMGLLLFVIFDKAAAIPALPAASAGATPLVSGSTQELGAFLFENHFVNLELAGLILTVAMIGAIMIARKHVVPSRRELPQMMLPESKPETVLAPSTPLDDDPHSIPVHGTRNPRQKVYPET